MPKNVIKILIQVHAIIVRKLDMFSVIALLVAKDLASDVERQVTLSETVQITNVIGKGNVIVNVTQGAHSLTTEIVMLVEVWDTYPKNAQQLYEQKIVTDVEDLTILHETVQTIP